MVEKVVRNGQVAVIISQDYGAGWSTWATNPNDIDILMYHPKLVELIESGKTREMAGEDVIAWWVENELGADVYLGGWGGLSIKWIPQGTKFRIEEYDGAEYIITEADLPHTA